MKVAQFFPFFTIAGFALGQVIIGVRCWSDDSFKSVICRSEIRERTLLRSWEQPKGIAWESYSGPRAKVFSIRTDQSRKMTGFLSVFFHRNDKLIMKDFEIAKMCRPKKYFQGIFKPWANVFLSDSFSDHPIMNCCHQMTSNKCKTLLAESSLVTDLRRFFRRVDFWNPLACPRQDMFTLFWKRVFVSKKVMVKKSLARKFLQCLFVLSFFCFSRCPVTVRSSLCYSCE